MDPTRMTDEELVAELERVEAERDLAELNAELEVFLANHSLRDVLLRSDPPAVARFMTLLQLMRPDLATKKRQRR